MPRLRLRPYPLVADTLPPEPVLARYWAKVDQSGGPEACWIWRGALSGKSHGQYGSFKIGGVVLQAIRVALFLDTGIIGEGLDACHRDVCGTETRCVNPRHLYWAPHRANIADNVRRHGRSPQGWFGRRRRPAQTSEE